MKWIIPILVILASHHCQSQTGSPHLGFQIKDFGLKDYISISKDLPHYENKSWNLVCQMPYNCHFQPWIQVQGAAGQVIQLNSSNPLVRYLTKTETFTTKSDNQSYEAKNWISGEGALYTIPAGVTVTAVKYRETGYDTEFVGSFSCSDEDYNILWKKGARTAYLCMRDWFYDCPDRERVGFWGDGTPELNQCFYAFDVKSHWLCKQLVRRPLDPEFYPGQQLEFLGEYGLWDYYMQTGDAESMKEVYTSTRNFLFDTYKFGNKKQWFDWGKENKDIAIIEKCFMYIDLKALHKMALLTGNERDTTIINSKLKEIKSTFDKMYWRGTSYRSDQVSEPDDRANAMAINAGLADMMKADLIFANVLTQKTYSSCFFDRWVFEALCTIGKEEYALQRMKARYKTMISASFSTLWEHYDRWWASRIDAFDEGSSLNHGWNPPVINLSRTVAGIAPVQAGWKTFQVLPKEGFLTWIKVVVPSVKGNIFLELNKSSDEYAIHLESPAHTTAIVGIPKKSFSMLKSIKVNGVTFWNGSVVGKVEGVSWYGEDDDYIKFKVLPGRWNFVGSGTLPVKSLYASPSRAEDEIRLDKKSWTASASVHDSSFLFSGDKIPIDVSAENAIDGDHWTGWRDVTKTQYKTQWFTIDMAEKKAFSKIVIDNSWALWDSPNRYSVSISDDGVNWSQSIAQGKGELGITTISFPVQSARYVRINQTGTDSVYYWSIYELDVYCKK